MGRAVRSGTLREGKITIIGTKMMLPGALKDLIKFLRILWISAILEKGPQMLANLSFHPTAKIIVVEFVML